MKLDRFMRLVWGYIGYSCYTYEYLQELTLLNIVQIELRQCEVLLEEEIACLLCETWLSEEFVAEERRCDADIETVDADFLGRSRCWNPDLVVDETEDAGPKSSTFSAEHENGWVLMEGRVLVKSPRATSRIAKDDIGRVYNAFCRRRCNDGRFLLGYWEGIGGIYAPSYSSTFGEEVGGFIDFEDWNGFRGSSGGFECDLGDWCGISNGCNYTVYSEEIGRADDSS
jgi:hypothetical protein